jgi:hypothetical protein
VLSTAATPIIVADPEDGSKCRSGICPQWHFNEVSPEAPQTIFTDRLGQGASYTTFRAIGDYQDGLLFMGAQVSQSLFANANVELGSVYLTVDTTQLSTDAPCTSFNYNLYFYDTSDHVYYENRPIAAVDCFTAKTTCVPDTVTVINETTVVFPPNNAKLFFEGDGPLSLGGVPVVVDFTAQGVVDLVYSIGWVDAPGTPPGINGFVELRVDVNYKTSIRTVFPYGLNVIELDQFSFDQKGDEVNDVSAPLGVASLTLRANAAYTPETGRGCSRVSVTNTKAGGVIGTELRVYENPDEAAILTRDLSLFDWIGENWYRAVGSSDCCTMCKQSCYSGDAGSYCDFATGQCVCGPGGTYSGIGCDLLCPRDCNIKSSESNNLRCTPEVGCTCADGSYGFNCLLQCPGYETTGQACTGNGVCNAEGVCECFDNFYGEDCSHTCPDASCSGHGTCSFDGLGAYCDCEGSFRGSSCQVECPDGCRGSGYCNAEGRCECHPGFSGDACGTTDVRGAGSAVRVDGNVDSFVDFEFDGNIRDKDGIITAFWFRVASAVTAEAELIRWRYANVRLTADGKLANCDRRGLTDECIRSTSSFNLVPGNWYHVMAGIKTDTTATGIQVYVTPGSGGGNSDSYACTPCRPSSSNCDCATRSLTAYQDDTDLGGIRIGRGLDGEMDNVVIVSQNPEACQVANCLNNNLPPDVLRSWWADLRTRTLPPQFPFLRFSFTADALYADVPLTQAHPQGSAYLVPSSIPLSIATLATDKVPFFKVRTDSTDEATSFNYAFPAAGRTFTRAKGWLSFVATTLTPTGPYDECTITASLRNQAGSSYSPLIEATTVSGGNKFYRIPLLPSMLDKLIAGKSFENRVSWSLDGTCPPGDSKVVSIVESFVELETPRFDPAGYFAGDPNGITRPNGVTLSSENGLTIAAWILRDPIRSTGAGSIVSVTKDEADRRPVHLGETYDPQVPGSGASVEFVSSQGGRLSFLPNNVPYTVELGTWTHVALTIRPVDSATCHMRIVINGAEQPISPNAPLTGNLHCQRVAVAAQGDSSFTFRIGRNFYGLIDSVVVLNDYLTAGEVTVLKDTAYQEAPPHPSLVLAHLFTDVSGARVGLGFYGIISFHRFELCPGYQSHGNVCGDRAGVGGVCYEASGSFLCDCDDGYAGSACLECPGGASNPCNKRGACFGMYDQAICACNDGFLGDACSFECPGQSDFFNRLGQICLGYGVCRLVGEKQTTPRCFCDAAADRYGPFCQFRQGRLPSYGSLECQECVGDFETCIDEEACVCADGYARGGTGGFDCLPIEETYPPKPIPSAITVAIVALVTVAGVAFMARRMRLEYLANPDPYTGWFERDLSLMTPAERAAYQQKQQEKQWKKAMKQTALPNSTPQW